MRQSWVPRPLVDPLPLVLGTYPVNLTNSGRLLNSPLLIFFVMNPILTDLKENSNVKEVGYLDHFFTKWKSHTVFRKRLRNSCNEWRDIIFVWVSTFTVTDSYNIGNVERIQSSFRPSWVMEKILKNVT